MAKLNVFSTIALFRMIFSYQRMLTTSAYTPQDVRKDTASIAWILWYSYWISDIGDVCRTDHHCRYLENTYCFEDECRCQKNFSQIRGKCYKFSDVNCTHDSTCKKYGHDYWCLLGACHQEGIYFDSADIHQWRAKCKCIHMTLLLSQLHYSFI